MRWLMPSLRRRVPTTLPHRRLVRPAVEACETRCLPSIVVDTTSTNWSGYAVNAAAGAVSAVSGTWTVPTVRAGSSGGSTYSAVWVGIDGSNSATVEQIGTEEDVIDGKAEYYAWYEMYPSDSRTITSFTVRPGDVVSASVLYDKADERFILTLTDGSHDFSTVQASGARLSSAEWVVESPSGRDILPLANFSSVAFSDARATIGGVTGAINSSGWHDATTYKMNMVNERSGQVEDVTSVLGHGRSSFSISYEAASSASVPAASSAASTPATEIATTTSVSVGAVRSDWGLSTVTVTATVTASTGTSAPTGVVELRNGARVVGYATLHQVNGIAEAIFHVMFFEPGSYALTARYLGNSTFAASTSAARSVSA